VITLFVLGAEGGQFLGTLRIGDTLRPESKSAITVLKSMGLKTILLTGDSRIVADRGARKFAEVVAIARRCRGIIFQNFAGTLLVDAVGICLAAVGLLNPLLAAFIHVSSELTFILNSARLLPGTRTLDANALKA
jgi:cation transport ATPase